EQPSEVFAEVATLRLVGEEITELFEGLLHDMGKRHDTGHGNASLTTARSASRQCTNAAMPAQLLSTLHDFSKKLNLTFDILTDLHLKTAEQIRLAFVLPDYLRALYKSFGNTLDRFHDESEYRLPLPARYVIDKEGIIRAADVNADYTIRPDPCETVKVLRALKA